MPRSKYFRFGIWILLLFTIIMVGSKISFVFQPIGTLITTLAAPILISGVLFYILRPVVRLLVRFKIPRVLAILLIYLLLIGLFIVLAFLIGPILNEQFMSLIDSMPVLVKEMGQQLDKLQHSYLIGRFHLNDISYQDITNKFSHSLGNISTSIGNNILNIIQSVTSFVIVMITVPFILFYMLKDGDRLPKNILKLIPQEHLAEGKQILSDMDEALSSYIQGQMIVSLFDGVFIFIWYKIIGLDYPLILALCLLFTNVIPFIGPFIGTAPAVIVGFIQTPIMAVYVIIGVLIVQQIEGNIVSPQVMGKKLAIHPITIIFILLVAGNLAGILGMLLAIPTYAVAKVIVTRSYKLLKLRHSKSIIK